MNRWFKRAISATVCLIPIGLVIGFSTSWVHSISLSCVGSSGVKPFVEFFGNEYYNFDSAQDVTVEAGGSGFGISQVANGFANIGNASKNPYSSIINPKNSHEQNWKINNIKTVTIAWEAICMIYIPPKGMSNDDLSKLDLVINESNINKLYATFSGFKSGPINSIQTISDFMIKDQISPAGKQLCEKTAIIPYVRTGGGKTSGTADAFYKDSHFKDPYNKLEKRQKEALENGIYGNEILIRETDEANSRAWDMFSKNNEYGSMVYLSSGFVETNKKLIESNGYKIMKYQNTNNNDKPKIYDYEIGNVTQGYDWFRPINSMLKADFNNYNAAMSFISWIFFGPTIDGSQLKLSDLYKNDLAKIGGVPLTERQILSMCNKNIASLPISTDDFWKSFWTGDFDLLVVRSGVAPVFGALEK